MPKHLLTRTLRLIKAMHPALAKPDDTFAKNILTTNEYALYMRMDPRDREHTTRVTKRLTPQTNTPLLRAALLHDCGKILRPYHWLERVIVGLIPEPKTRQILNTNWYKHPISAFELRNQHALIGEALILDNTSDSQVAEIVREHHNPNYSFATSLLYTADQQE